MSEREIAKIESTFLGVEDHGILTAQVMVDYGGSGQGIGGYALDEPVRDEQDRFVCRRGTAYGMEWIARFMRACGVDSWEKVCGRTIMVIKSDDGRVTGVEPLPTEPGKRFIFAELLAEVSS